jgi:hypothetical protein
MNNPFFKFAFIRLRLTRMNANDLPLLLKLSKNQLEFPVPLLTCLQSELRELV